MIARYSLPEISGIWEDENKFAIMLQIELLVCEAYAKRGIVPKSALSRIRKKASFNVGRINKIEEKTNHDIIAFVTDVARSIGPDAKYLHVGMTSSDLLDTTLGVQLKQTSDILVRDVKKLIVLLSRKARQYKHTVCIGRTHGVHAEPVTFGLKLALWYEETKRNLSRLLLAKEAVSVGKLSGAVGTYSNIDPHIEEYVCRKLGLKPAKISTQVIQRDVYAQYLMTLALIGASLEKFAMEIRHLQKTEVLEAEEPFAKGQKGSSAMPHKRNPVICERICGLARLLRNNAGAALENISLWHERDISHSSVERVIIPDSTIIMSYMLKKFIEVVNGMTVYPTNMMANVVKTKGLIFSQRVLLKLMAKGLARPVAYDLVQKCAMKTWQQDSISFRDSLLENRKVSRYLSAEDLDDIFNLDYYLRNINKIFKNIGL